jgi:DNA-binding response OmpR family regulator
VEASRVNARVLVIEDEHSIANVVRIALQRDGYRVAVVTSGEAGLIELDRSPFGLVVLDIGLPGIDGLEVCRRIRTRSNVPIIFLTARDDEIDRVVGLELGADDYLPKPFSPRELAARVKAVLRRTQPQPPNEVVQLGDVLIDRSRHEVRISGEKVELTPKEFELLACLAENPNVVVSRDRLLERVWGLSFPGGTRTVDQHVAQLRAKLGRPALIETVRGLGYKAVGS